MPIVDGDNVGAYAHGFPLRMMAHCINKGDTTYSIGVFHRGISPSSFWRCSCDLKLLARAQKDSSGTENGPVMGGGKRFLLVPAASRFRLPEPARSRSGLRHAMHYPMALPTERGAPGRNGYGATAVRVRAPLGIEFPPCTAP